MQPSDFCTKTNQKWDEIATDDKLDDSGKLTFFSRTVHVVSKFKKKAKNGLTEAVTSLSSHIMGESDKHGMRTYLNTEIKVESTIQVSKIKELITTSKNGLFSLPTDILKQICLDFDSKTFISLSKTSKYFHDLYKNSLINGLNNNLTLDDFTSRVFNKPHMVELVDSDINKIIIYFGPFNCASLTKLNLINTKITNLDFLEKFENIKILSLSNCNAMCDVRGLQYLKKLEDLHLCHLNLSNLKFLEMTNKIKKLSMHSCSGIVNLDQINKYVQLESLSLSNIRIEIINYIKLEKLKYLYINDHFISSINFLEQCRNLEMVELTNCSGISDINALENCSELKSLKLYQCENFNLESLKNLKNLNKIQSIYFRLVFHLKNLNCIKHFTNIKKIEVSECYELINIDGLENMKNLEKINFFGCYHIENYNVLLTLPKLKIIYHNAHGIPEQLRNLVQDYNQYIHHKYNKADSVSF